MNDYDNPIDTTSSEETIAVLLGEVARHSPVRALRILSEHVGMEEVRAHSDATQYDKNTPDEVPSAEDIAGLTARMEAFREFNVYIRGLISGLAHTAKADEGVEV